MLRTKPTDLNKILGKASNGYDSVVLQRNKRGKFCTVEYFRGEKMIHRFTGKEQDARDAYEREAERILRR